MLGATLAFAQAGRIGLFSDIAGTNCAITDAAPGLLPVYAVHIGTSGATACEFSAPKPTCFTASYLSDTAVFGVSLGTSPVGVSIGYGVCKTVDTHVLTINFFAQGTTLPCCIYPVGPHTLTGATTPQMVDCEEALINAAGQSGVVNSNLSCTCPMIIPAQDSSWGKIKALYSE
jgi:hypothetical protein